MCLFSIMEDSCRHAECRLIKTVRHLNEDVFRKSETSANKVILPTVTTLPYSERHLPRVSDGSSRSGSQHILSEGTIQENPENPESDQDIIGKLREEVSELTRKVSLITLTLQHHGIYIAQFWVLPLILTNFFLLYSTLFANKIGKIFHWRNTLSFELHSLC